MGTNQEFGSFVDGDRVIRRLVFWIVATSLIILAFLFGAGAVNAAGAIQISGIGYPDAGDCANQPTAPDSYDYAIDMTGDLDGCWYITVLTNSCSPSGTYNETGTEVYVSGGNDVIVGTFETTYR